MELEDVHFYGGMKTGEPEERPSEKRNLKPQNGLNWTKIAPKLHQRHKDNPMSVKVSEVYVSIFRPKNKFPYKFNKANVLCVIFTHSRQIWSGLITASLLLLE